MFFNETKKLDKRIIKLEKLEKQRTCKHHFREFVLYKATSISDTFEIFADCELCDLKIERNLKGEKIEDAYELLIKECKV